AAPMFDNRWRWNASRALAVLRFEGGRKVPMPLQRMRAEDLLAAVFPQQLGCADNPPAAPIPIPDHPLLPDTVDNLPRDATGLDGVQGGFADGRIWTVAVDTVGPSPRSHEILHSNPHTYLDDAPLEERRARAVTLRQAIPELGGGLGALDPAAIEEVAAQAWPVVRDADDLHDVLLSLGVLPRALLESAGWAGVAHDLLRAARATWAGDLLVAAERAALVRLALPGVRFAPAVQEVLFGRHTIADTEEDALRAIVGGWLECTGPMTAAELAERS